MRRNFKIPQCGATTIYFLLFTSVMLGLLVMAVDVGRFYVIQGELQTAADAAALAAATHLVGTMSGTVQADQQWNASFDSTTGNDNRFNLGLNRILFSSNLAAQTTVLYFSSVADAIGNTGGLTGAGIDWGSGAYPKYARVQISAQAPILFAPFLNRSPGSLPTVTVSAIAGLSAPLCTTSGIDAFAVVDPSMTTDTDNFGLMPGNWYTLYLTTPSTTTTPPAPLASTDPTILVPYVILDHYPNGVQQPGPIDDSLFELAAGGISNNPASVPPPGSLTIGSVEVAYGSPNAVVLPGTATTPSRDILCGLNVRLGVDLSLDPNCNGSNNSSTVNFPALASLFSADTDVGAGAYAAGVQDFAVDYCQDGACNLRRVLTVPVVDSTDTLNVLNFRQFLVDASSTVPQGVDASLMNGTFRAQYIGSPVPVRTGTLGGSCNVSSGVGRVVLH